MNFINYANTANLIDLSLYYFGTQECTKGHSFGPAMKEHFKIHYIHKGKGIYKVGEKTYPLGQNQGFLICPNTLSYYAADSEAPWTYSWIGFNGLNAEGLLWKAGLSVDQPIFTYDRDDAIAKCLEEMVEANTNEKSRELRLQCLLYTFLANLLDNSEGRQSRGKALNVKNEYIAKVIEFVRINYSNKISVSELADSVHLNKKYLTSIFKDEMGVPILEYIINYRINKACDLMKDTRLSIGDIARSVGYDDPFLFSRMFKKVKGASPRQYRSGSHIQHTRP